jgi:hypothetical protein
MPLCRVLGGSEYHEKFVGLLLEVRQPRRSRNEPSIGNQFQPEYDFVDLFHHDSYFGDELSSRSGSARGTVVYSHCCSGAKQLPSQDSTLLALGKDWNRWRIRSANC